MKIMNNSEKLNKIYTDILYHPVLFTIKVAIRNLFKNKKHVIKMIYK